KTPGWLRGLLTTKGPAVGASWAYRWGGRGDRVLHRFGLHGWRNIPSLAPIGTPIIRKASDAFMNYPKPSWPALLGFGLLTRIAVVVLGCVLGHSDLPGVIQPPDEALASIHQDMKARHQAALAGGSRCWLEPWYRWDALWYVEISERGYA